MAGPEVHKVMLRMPQELWLDLERLRSAVQVQLGEHVSLNRFILEVLRAEVRMVRENSPGVEDFSQMELPYSTAGVLTSEQAHG